MKQTSRPPGVSVNGCCGTSADYTFVIIDMGIDGPPVHKLCQQIRRDLRSSTLPIGLLSNYKEHDRPAARIAFDDLRTEAFPWPTEPKTVDYQLQQMLSFVARRAADADERLLRAQQSMEWLTQISAKPQALYDVARHQAVAERGLTVPALRDSAAMMLANLGTHTAQRLLVEVASQSARPLALRQLAAAAFSKSVPALWHPINQRRNAPTIRSLQREPGPRPSDPKTSRIDSRCPRITCRQRENRQNAYEKVAFFQSVVKFVKIQRHDR